MGKTWPQRFESLGKLVPVLHTYLEREQSRDLDKVIRDELAKKIQELINQLGAAKQAMVDNNVLLGLDLLDRSVHKLEKVRDSIKFAPRGYTGLFDYEQMANDQLDRLVEFDRMLFDKAAILAGALNEAMAKPGDLKAVIGGFDAQINEFENTLNQRDAYARERQVQK